MHRFGVCLSVSLSRVCHTAAASQQHREASVCFDRSVGGRTRLLVIVFIVISLFSVVRQKDRCWLQVSCHFSRVWFWRCDKRHMLGCKSVCNRQDVSKSAAISFNGVLPPANATVALLQFALSPYKLHLWRMAVRTRYHVVWMHCDWKTFVRKWKCLLYMSYKTYYLAVIFSV